MLSTNQSIDLPFLEQVIDDAPLTIEPKLLPSWQLLSCIDHRLI
jgi:hypothetical protein